MKFALSAALLALLAGPLLGSGEQPTVTGPEGLVAPADPVTATSVVPEPNTLLVAGIGSLAILLFTVRRK